jgi:hypothetical protein
MCGLVDAHRRAPEERRAVVEDVELKTWRAGGLRVEARHGMGGTGLGCSSWPCGDGVLGGSRQPRRRRSLRACAGTVNTKCSGGARRRFASYREPSTIQALHQHRSRAAETRALTPPPEPPPRAGAPRSTHAGHRAETITTTLARSRGAAWSARDDNDLACGPRLADYRDSRRTHLTPRVGLSCRRATAQCRRWLRPASSRAASRPPALAMRDAASRGAVGDSSGVPGFVTHFDGH